MTWLDDYIKEVNEHEANFTIMVVSEEITLEQVASIKAIPENVLPEPLRSFYIERASKGFDVSAYVHHPFGPYFVMDDAIRITFSEKPITWVIDSILPLGMKEQCWSVHFHNVMTKESFFIELCYRNFMYRNSMTHILSYFQHCNVRGELPESNYK